MENLERLTLFFIEFYKTAVQWFKHLLEKNCGLRNLHHIKLSFLDTPRLSTKCKNSVISLISSFIVSTCRSIKSNMDDNAIGNI